MHGGGDLRDFVVVKIYKKSPDFCIYTSAIALIDRSLFRTNGQSRNADYSRNGLTKFNMDMATGVA